MNKHALVLTTILVLTANLSAIWTVKDHYGNQLREAQVQNLKNIERSKSLLLSEQKASENLKKQVNTLKSGMDKLQKEKEGIQRENERLKAQRMSLPSRGEDRFSTFKATAYDADGSGMEGSKLTAIGTHVRDNRTIAVDPDVIPLRSRVVLSCKSNPEVDGEYIAEDTGGRIRGNRIDIYMSDSDQMLKFGVREVKLRVIK